ncbi:hypothetical protein PPERSA_11482 [Pseudocohnilembus persalinus]|uniref:tRNA-uridine aminocarboxypropyltransferase n=1 Tax=Pseudocohnilembus persalinus TaxID=266149 RepID=A0A0V0QY80_PSEPJ|nr:hypothetical protein PPERSA_11482 [Pseudocohnilembus persalinus]|eukprot:KRX06837.1 hypothetical protein PPERSA_11482 [Pseudocohnilembus persalinus]
MQQNNNNQQIQQKICDKCQFKSCLCEKIPQIELNAEFCLIYHQNEQFKATNTGQLLENAIKKVDKFLWSRIKPNPDLLLKLQSEKYQPYLLFPGNELHPSIQFPSENQEIVTEYKIEDKKQNEEQQEQQQLQNEEQQLQQQQIDEIKNIKQFENQNLSQIKIPVKKCKIYIDKIPYFIIIDGVWKEANKIVKQSPYLQNIPRLELKPDKVSQFSLRRRQREDGLCTCEVGIYIIRNCLQEKEKAQQLEEYYEQFVQQFQKEQKKRYIRDEEYVIDKDTRQKILKSKFDNEVTQKKVKI